MRILVFALMLSIPSAPQKAASILRRACGPHREKYSVTLDASQHKLPIQQPGKALIYFAQDFGSESRFEILGTYITKVGIDGQWVGAEKNDSWFSVFVAPGAHYLCVQPQGLFGNGKVTELLHFTAAPGHVYYFRIRNYTWITHSLTFHRAESNQVLYMIYSSPQSISKPHK